MSNADDFFAAARRLGEAIVAERAARREALRLARNARRRARRATRPRPAAPAPVEVVAYEPDAPEECYCAATSMPPCSWCENFDPDA